MALPECELEKRLRTERDEEVGLVAGNGLEEVNN